MEQYGVGDGGWVSCTSTDFPSRIRVRFVDESGYLRPVELLVEEGGEKLTATLMRRLPIGQIEAFVNRSPDAAENLRSRLHKPGPVKFLAGTKPAEFGRRQKQRDLLIDVPVSRDRGDGFYRDVLDVYGIALEMGHRAPARAVAEANKVPVTTVHRWVKEAKRRREHPDSTEKGS